MKIKLSFLLHCITLPLVQAEEDLERLVSQVRDCVSSEEIMKLAKSAWLAGQFLGEICDYEPGTLLLQHVSFA